MHLVQHDGRVKYLYCDVCGKRPWKHHDWEMRCDCEPEDDDPTPEEIFIRAREARMMTRDGTLPCTERRRIRKGITEVNKIERRIPVNDYELEKNAESRRRVYRDDLQ